MSSHPTPVGSLVVLRPVLRFSAAALSLLLCPWSVRAQAVAPSLTKAPEELIKLDPFTVVTNRDVGFVAASSLAGGRLASDLVDTPVAYSVQTREFLDALNIRDVNEALNWTVNATTTPDDGGGQLFGGTGSSTIRGVAANPGNRNFFAGGTNPATYNLERMDYARGPNSILFGTGTISGTANAVLKSADLIRNRNEIRAEFGSWEAYRATLDVNRKVSQNVAVRVTTNWQDSQTWRDWERTQRFGVSPSVSANLTKTTKLTVIGDYYEQKVIAGMNALTDAFSGWDGRTTYSGLQPATLPTQTPFGASRIGNNTYVWSPASGKSYNTVMSYTGLMQTQSFSGQRLLNGVATLSTANLGFNGVQLLDLPATPDGLYDVAAANSEFRMPGRSFTNIGPNPTAINRFRDATFFLTQNVGSALTLQLSGAANKLRSYGNITYYSNQGYPNVLIDINRLLPDGSTNPNVLKPYNESSRPERQLVETENQALRLAAAYVKTTRWVDIKANLVGALEDQESFKTREYYMLPVDPDSREWGLISSPNRTQTIRYRYYWDQKQREIPEFQEVSLVDSALGTTRTFKPLWVLGADRSDATILSTSNVKYYQASANLAFFNKRVILLGAYRADTLERGQKQFLAAMDHPTGAVITRSNFLYRPAAPDDYWRLSYVPKDAAGRPTGIAAPATARPRDGAGIGLAQYAKDRFQNDYNPPTVELQKSTKAVGGIVNLGRGFSLWANYAQTFNPANLGSTTIDFGTPSSSVSNGLDYGVRISFGPRFYTTISRYESKEESAGIAQPSGYSNIVPILQTNALGDLSSDGRNIRGVGDLPPGWLDQLDRQTRGYELETVANLKSNWRLTLNFGLADAAQTNAYRQTRAWLDSKDSVLRQILDDAGIQFDGAGIASAKPGVTTASSPDVQTAVNAWNNLQASRANWVTGKQLLNRLTKYTANFYTDYRLTDGPARGLRLGYGMQFRGPQVIGYRGADTMVNPDRPTTAIDDPKVDAYTPVWQKSYFLGTATVGYPVTLPRRRKVEFNLTVGNLFDYSKPLHNTAGLRPPDGNVASPARVSYARTYSYTTPRNYRLTASYAF
jgi:outer membrane receptor protein involved in Fe transport